ncbi:MAG: hypothetical protein QGF53_00865 [Alphaproteobacteria bacterium]|jgi:hypothetical protein|nr:hypothetical protein [Alphaproteobacteria bacterium]
MGHIVDLGKRIELVPMDRHFHDVTLALYERPGDAASFQVHTYSGHDGSAGRMAWISEAMQTLGGMVADGDKGLRFPCGSEHAMAVRRLFLETCKLDPAEAVAPKPLTVFDKKSDGNITVASLGEGRYQVSADDPANTRRITAVAGGLVKLAEMEAESDDTVAFSCGHSHDALIGMLLTRALNVRIAMREQAEAAGRGVLAAPSAQE